MENDDSNGPSLWALLKGAPEIVQPFLTDAPPDYEQSYKRFASEGARSVALAATVLALSGHISTALTLSRSLLSAEGILTAYQTVLLQPVSSLLDTAIACRHFTHAVSCTVPVNARDKLLDWQPQKPDAGG